MKHFILALVIALLSTPAATTAWSQQTEQTTPTEQETKGFIVEALKNCPGTNEVKFEGSTLHLRTFGTARMIVPVHELASASFNYVSDTLSWQCKATDSSCILSHTNEESTLSKHSRVKTTTCPDATNVVLAKAFNHLIGIYKAENPPLFE